ncbi:hypothetical protein BB561_003759 [Smittium simulii]|uniref:GAF domain-containing protein n=1 Tax=Smittium simulii TaxID=133385 RepID=A0A2T9YJM5_9FUNG|nr:hypothetical protein BB561_003759 [Smittium simulii]
MVYDITHKTIDASTKQHMYAELLSKFKALADGERDWVTNMSNLSALVFHELYNSNFEYKNTLNWAGFYYVNSNEANLSKSNNKPCFMRLGPFQGKVACTRINFGSGVCGAAAESKLPQLVSNVHDFPGHIACDAASVSEVVIPIVISLSDSISSVIGVLDLDCSVPAAFDHDDVTGLTSLANHLAAACDWPESVFGAY